MLLDVLRGYKEKDGPIQSRLFKTKAAPQVYMFKDGPMQSHMFWQSKADDLTHYLYSINGRARVIPGAAHICEKLVGRAAREDRQVVRHAELRDDLLGSCVPAAHRHAAEAHICEKLVES